MISMLWSKWPHGGPFYTKKNSFRPQATSCFIRILIFFWPRVTSFFPTKMRFHSNFTKTQSILDSKVLRSVDSTTFQFNYRTQKTSESLLYFAIKLYYKTIFQTYRHRVCKYIRRYLAYLQIWTFQHFRHIKCNSPKATIYTPAKHISLNALWYFYEFIKSSCFRTWIYVRMSEIRDIRLWVLMAVACGGAHCSFYMLVAVCWRWFCWLEDK